MRKKRIFCLMLDEFQIQALSKYSNGIGRLACFEHLLLHAERQDTVHTKRGISYIVQKGSLVISEEELSVQWLCNRTTVHRILKIISRFSCCCKARFSSRKDVSCASISKSSLRCWAAVFSM